MRVKYNDYTILNYCNDLECILKYQIPLPLADFILVWSGWCAAPQCQQWQAPSLQMRVKVDQAESKL